MKAALFTIFIGICIYLSSISIIDMYQRDITEYNLIYLIFGLVGIIIMLLIFIIYKSIKK